jgi:hypothetical protein
MRWVSQGMPTGAQIEEGWVRGFIHLRVVDGERRVERRMDRLMVAKSVIVDYIPPSLVM